eukprot:COSAG01_NODE_65740_length_272_cov_0.884393_1_plen_41_part_10
MHNLPKDFDYKDFPDFLKFELEEIEAKYDVSKENIQIELRK